MSPNPVSYAEDVLGVHAVWVEADERLAAHGKLVRERADLHKQIRTIKTRIVDRETDLTVDAPSAFPDASATERTRLLKVAFHKDAALQDMRAEEDDLQATLDMIDADVRHHETGLRVLSARMEELAGLLHFYASARSKSHTQTER